ncbi:hypothetical protein [Limimaricola pyoseonensis]|uniref:Uncharacterized protein n=1 Tax=Limimaricola pyoseonensis TaxID=521013 RepID=A0A1G7GTY3_9RHOB|nr:hypothetical protein [Limimaricola pyoseonensis]SDE91607.1 hypothetical protein SAMN04488567_2926 [Limimaricola pyoseonensis]
MTPDGSGDAARGWRWRLGIMPALLAVPFLAMQMTPAVRWSPADFALAAAILTAAIGLQARLVRGRSRRFRIAVSAGLAAALGLVWAQGAVGLF